MKHQYPGVKEAERQKSLKHYVPDDEPDFIGNAPNYEKFERKYGWDVEKILVWLNVD